MIKRTSYIFIVAVLLAVIISSGFLIYHIRHLLLGSRYDNSNIISSHISSISKFYQLLSRENNDINILEYPAFIQFKFNPYPYYQPLHNKNIMYGYIQSHALKKQWKAIDILKSDIWILDVILSKVENNKINFSSARHLLNNALDMYDVNTIYSRNVSFIILHKNVGREIKTLLDESLDLQNFSNTRMIEHTKREAKHLRAFYRYYFGDPVFDDDLITVFKVTNKDSISSQKSIITFQFDHPFISQYTLARPLFAKKGIKGTLMVNTNEVQNQSKFFMSWAQLKEMYDEGWEVGSHSATHPDMRTLNESQIRFELARSKEILQNHGFQDIVNFAYPYNWYNINTVYIISEYYRSARTSVAQTGFALNPGNLRPFELSAYEARLTLDNVGHAINAVDEAKSKGRWLIFILHELSDTQINEETMSVEVSDIRALENLVDYILDRNIPIRSTNDALDYYVGYNK